MDLPCCNTEKTLSENEEVVTFARHIAHLLGKYVSRDWGMTNKTVDYIARLLCPNVYVGLFMPNELQRKKNVCKPFTMIVNVGRHFVTIYCHDDFVLYMDPFGLPCLQSRVRDYLCSLSTSLFYNKTRIQHQRSKHCGLYAVLFALYYDKPDRNIKLKFKDGVNNQSNDRTCLLYLQKLNKSD